MDGPHSNLAKFRNGSTRERNALVVEIPVEDVLLLFVMPVEPVEPDGSGGGILSGIVSLLQLERVQCDPVSK